MTMENHPLTSKPETKKILSDQAMPGAWLALVLLLGINLFNYLDRQVLAALLHSIEKHFLEEGGKSNGTLLGILAASFLVSYMVFAPIFGWLAGKMPRWWLIGIGVIVWSLASGASGLSGWVAGIPGFALLVLTRCFVGIGEAAYGPAAPDVLSDLFPVRIRGQVLSWFYVAIPVGSALGYILGGMAGWPLAFYLVVPPGLLLGLACFFLREPPRGEADLENPHAVRKISLQDYKRLFRNRSYVLDTAGMACYSFGLGGIAIWVPYYLINIRKLGDEASVNSIFGVILVVSGLLGTVAGGLAGDALRGKTKGSYFLVSGLAMLLSFPMLLGVLWGPSSLIWLLIFMTCFLLFFNTGPTNTILANVTHPSLRAPGFALNIFLIHALGDAISPILIGKAGDLLGKSSVDSNGNPIFIKNLDAGFVVVALILLLGSILWLIGTRYLAHDTENAMNQLDD